MLDLIVIGAGPGGTELALGADALSWDVALVEKDTLGGTCVNRGCIPTKALLHATESLITLEQLMDEGLSQESILEAQREALSLDVLLPYRDRQSQASVDGLKSQLKRSKVQLIEGNARIVEPGKVEVDGTVYEAKRIVLATGSVPAIPPIPGLDLPGVYTSDAFLDAKANWPQPLNHLVIIGGGVIGVEMADVCQRLGIQVTVIEALDRLLPNLDKGLSRALKQTFKKRGIDVYTGSAVQEVTSVDDALEVHLDDESIACDAVLVATGRRALTEEVTDLEIAKERHSFKVNEHFETSVPGIYAIGDVRSGSLMLAHEATNDARQLLNIWKGGERNYPAVPSCIYTNPEIAQVGLTQDDAKEQGIKVQVARASTLANARNRMAGGERGYVNLVFNEEGILLGAQWMGDRATDLIDQLTTAIDLKLSIQDLRQSIKPHPTFVETLDQALLAAEAKLKR